MDIKHIYFTCKTVAYSEGRSRCTDWLNKTFVSDDDNQMVTQDFQAGSVAGSQNSD